MTIASEIQRIKDNIANAYTAAEAKGATMPVTENSDSLATTIESITAGGGGEQVEAKNYTGANILEGDKVWINPYHYEADNRVVYGATTNSSINGNRVFYLDSDVLYLPGLTAYYNKLYHKDGADYNINLNIGSSYVSRITVHQYSNGVVYVKALNSSNHITTMRIDAGLLWTKIDCVPILGDITEASLLVDFSDENATKVYKINIADGTILQSWSFNSGFGRSAYTASNTMFGIIGISATEFLMSNSNMSDAVATYKCTLNNDGTVTYTNTNVHNFTDNLCYKVIGYSNGFIIKNNTNNNMIIDIRNLQNCVDRTTDLNLEGGYSSNYLQIKANGILVSMPSSTIDSSNLKYTGVWKLHEDTGLIERIALDIETLASGSPQGGAQCFNGVSSDLSEFYHSGSSTRYRYMVPLLEKSGNNLVSYNNQLTSIKTQTGIAAENIVAGGTGLVNVASGAI